MEHILNFTKEKVFHKISLNDECPFFKITKFSIPNKEHIPIYNNDSQFSFYCKQSKGHNSIIQPFHAGFLKNANEDDYENTIPYVQSINNGSDFRYNEIEIFCKDYKYPGIDFNIYYETRPLTISIENPFKSFHDHIEEGGNCRILFSAPYGQGKTTFLREFFMQNEKKYEPFFIFPVNYSIAKNEDIFKYIKCQILFQLLKKDVTFDKKDFSYLETLPAFVLKHPDKLLSPFLKLLPSIGGSLFEIYEKLKELSSEYFENQNEIHVDDKVKAINFIERIYEEEGSIFEDNFYSQLIRQLIEQLNQRGKQTVLVIDDMDRMDPDHIFRVLNIFAAHFDSPEYTYNSNKFGFKKIVFVCDIKNIKRLYQHRFGLEVDFAGYVDKFFSNSIFHYNNKTAISSLIESLHSQNNNQLNIFALILNDLLITDNLSLREIIKLKKTDLFIYDIENGEPRERFRRYKNSKFNYFSHIYYLSLIFSFEEIIQKFDRCSEQIDSTESKISYSFLFSKCLPSVINSIDENNLMYYQYNGKNLSFNVKKYRIQNDGFYYDVSNLLLEGNTIEFTGKDFYNILIEVTRKYQFMGGLEGN